MNDKGSAEDLSKRYNTLLPHLWRVCRKNNRKEKVSRAKPIEFNYASKHVSNDQSGTTQISKMENATPSYTQSLDKCQKLPTKSKKETSAEANILYKVEESNDSAYSSDDNMRNLDNVVIKKPVKKASSWNVANIPSLVESQAKDGNAENASITTKSGFNATEDKVEYRNALGGRFSLFPASTDSDPMSVLRRNLKASSSYFSEENSSSSNKDKGLKYDEQKGEIDSNVSSKKDSLNKGSEIQTNNYNRNQNYSTLDKKQTFCLEATLKHLDLEAAILPSI